MSNAETAPKLVKKHFDEAAPYWKDVYSQDTLDGAMYRQRRDGVLGYVDSLQLPVGALALEVGCGAGLTSIGLARLGFQVNAVDAVPEMVRMTQEAARAQGVPIQVMVGDVQALEFPPSIFDLAVAVGVMEWMPSPENPLRELNRVLKNGGHLVTNVDNAWALHCVVDPRMSAAVAGVKRFGRRLAVRLGFISAKARPSRSSRAKFDAAIRRAGFVKVASSTGGFGPFTVLGLRLLPERLAVRLHHRLQNLADGGAPIIRNGGETYLVLARKEGEQRV